MNEARNPFKLNTNDETFKQRQKDVFDQLAVLEKNRVNTMDVDQSEYAEIGQSRDDSNFDRAYARKLRGKHSIFKKPQNPAPRNYLRRLPDFKKNPHKWTRYSLDDVKDEDMSDKGNTRAALAFLREIEARKKTQDGMEEDGDEKPKVLFRRRTLPDHKPNKIETGMKASFSSSKVVMPEYVIGQAAKKEKVKKEKVDVGKQLKLDHLLDDEEDE